MEKILTRVAFLLVVSLLLFGCGYQEQNNLAQVVPVQVPAAAVTDSSALLTWYWPPERPEPPGIVDYNLYINNWAAGSTKNWRYGAPGQPRTALVQTQAGQKPQEKFQCTLTGLEDYTYYQVYLEPVLANGKTLPRSMMTVATKPAGEALHVLEFGVLGDNSRDDTEMLQRIINLCPPGGKVVLRRGTYYSGPLRVHGQMTLKLKDGAVLKALPAATPNVAAVLPLPDTTLALLNCVEGTDFCLSGPGGIEGGDYPLLSCRKTGNVYLQGVRLQAGAGREPALVLLDCRGLVFNDVRFQDFSVGRVQLTGSTDLLAANCRLPL